MKTVLNISITSEVLSGSITVQKECDVPFYLRSGDNIIPHPDWSQAEEVIWSEFDICSQVAEVWLKESNLNSDDDFGEVLWILNRGFVVTFQGGEFGEHIRKRLRIVSGIPNSSWQVP